MCNEILRKIFHICYLLILLRKMELSHTFTAVIKKGDFASFMKFFWYNLLRVNFLSIEVNKNILVFA